MVHSSCVLIGALAVCFHSDYCPVAVEDFFDYLTAHFVIMMHVLNIHTLQKKVDAYRVIILLPIVIFECEVDFEKCLIKWPCTR